MKGLIDVGLGLGYHELRLARATQDWVSAGSSLRDQIAAVLNGIVAGVEQIGSSSVVGLLAKPIVDLAVGVLDHHELSPVRHELEAAGWIYRGDAGHHGGHVFVLEVRPWYRVAHVHVVDHGGEQWRDYLRLRDLLRRSRDARAEYDAVKLRLIEEFGQDRKRYTDGKSDVVRSLLGESR